MRWLTLLAAGMLFALLAAACASAPGAKLHFALAISGDRDAAAERIRERIAGVDRRDDVRLGAVAVTPAGADELHVEVEVHTEPGCPDLAVTADAVREALLKPRRLDLRETLPFSPELRERVREMLPEAIGITLGMEGDSLELTAPAGTDLAGAVRRLRIDRVEFALEPLDRRPSRDASAALWALAEVSELDQLDIAEARSVADERTGRPQVSVHLTASGAQRFEALTARRVGKPLAILVDGQVMSVPRVMEPIPGGRIQITLGMDKSAKAAKAEAEALAMALSTGPVAERVELVSESSRCEVEAP